jgi:hypothetical protein
MNKAKIKGIRKSAHELCDVILEEPEYPELKNDKSKKYYSHPLYCRAGDGI